MNDAHTGPRVLIVRAWYETGHEHALRIRVLEASSGDRPDQDLLTTSSSDTACATVCAWLTALSAPSPAGPDNP